jgi:hypothetical protein
VGVPFARLRRDVRWHCSTVPSSVCVPWCFDEVFLDSAQHGSSTCPPSSALAPPTSSHSWSHADGYSHGLASSPSTPGSTSSGTLSISVAGHLQPALEPPPPLFMSPAWTWTLQGSRWTYNIASIFTELPSSSPHAAFLNIDTARFRLDLQHYINFHGAVLCMQVVVYRSYNFLRNTMIFFYLVTSGFE